MISLGFLIFLSKSAFLSDFCSDHQLAEWLDFFSITRLFFNDNSMSKIELQYNFKQQNLKIKLVK